MPHNKGVIVLANREIIRELEEKALTIRKWLMDLTVKGIHIGGDLSVADIMVAVWQYAMKYDPGKPDWKERDRFVLSKGHASAVTTLNQVLRGCYTFKDVMTEYATDFGRFGMHSCNLRNPYVDVSTGSLGHGLPVAGGMAAALKFKQSSSRVFVVMGDGELSEGSIWEAALSAPNMKLGNLVGIVDQNGLSLDNSIATTFEPLADKWRSFNWNVVTVDGHDMEQLVDAMDNLPAPSSDVPTIIISKSVKGQGTKHMAGDINWHFGGCHPDFIQEVKDEMDAAFSKKWR